jgi:hypothetical protein
VLKKYSLNKEKCSSTLLLVLLNAKRIGKLTTNKNPAKIEIALIDKYNIF